jgi:dimethylargininase
MRAWVREVSPQLERCELSFVARAAIDVARAVRQHRDYTCALRALGCELFWLPALPQHPDAVFVEDTAVLLPEVAVIARPGAPSRRGETASVAAALAPEITLAHISAPGCLEGGDVLRIGRRLYVGASLRSNGAGIEQLAAAVAPFGYSVRTVSMRGCLHLKSACSFIPPDALIVNPDWVEPAQFACPRVVAVADSEPYGANALTVGGTTLVSAAYPQTAARLRECGLKTSILDVGELHKAEAALTCMSLLLEPRAAA